MSVTFPPTPFTFLEALDLGISRRQLYDACRSGDLRRPLTGLFVSAEMPDGVEFRARCAAKLVQPGAVVVDRTAAWIHGVDAFDVADHVTLPPVESCVPPTDTRSRRHGVDGHRRDLAIDDVMTIHGLRVTTPLRTALDLGCLLREPEALGVLDAFRRLHGLTLTELLRELPRYAGRRGVVQLRALIPISDPRAESMRESRMRLAVVRAGLPAPEPQLWIEIDGVPVYRLDLAYAVAKIAIEYDGLDFHEKSPSQKERDEKRREWLERNGWTVIVVRRGDFSGPNLDRWLAELRRALRPAYSNRRW